MELNTLQDLYVHQLKDMYSAEKQITKALPKMIRAASSTELVSGLEEHLAVTERHITRLEEILTGLGESTRGPKCKGMEGLLEEGAETLKAEADADVLDAAIIAAAQRVEHYEIAGYGTLRTYAETLGYADAARLLDTTAGEEGEADKLLTEIAQGRVNLLAASGNGSQAAGKEAGPSKRGSKSSSSRARGSQRRTVATGRPRAARAAGGR